MPANSAMAIATLPEWPATAPSSAIIRKVAHPRARRIVGAGFPRATDQESDRQREQEAENG